jgi:tRNA dimethylallyltransferase
MKDTKKPLIVILGPTGVGKTEIATRIAERFQGEIVSADSRLFYRGMDIGTAKPTPEEQTSVPHHLIDVADPDQDWSLAVYLPRALEIIQDIQSRKKLPFLVGGTGQYIQAVIQGWDLPEIKPAPVLRAALKDWSEEIGPEGMRKRLAVLDHEAAEGIDGPNIRRMIRAMEVILTSGRKFSTLKTKSGSPFNVFQVGLIRPREELYQRIDLRIEKMLQAGLVSEVQSLLDAGYSPDLSSLSAIGYKQIIAHLLEGLPLEEAVRQIRSKTRKYVRQQANWFKKNDPEIHWFSASNHPEDEICSQIQQFLSYFCYTEM